MTLLNNELRLLVQRLTNLRSNASFSSALLVIKKQRIRLVLSSQFHWFLPVKMIIMSRWVQIRWTQMQKTARRKCNRWWFIQVEGNTKERTNATKHQERENRTAGSVGLNRWLDKTYAGTATGAWGAGGARRKKINPRLMSGKGERSWGQVRSL